MANPKELIWGAPSSWIYSKRQAGLETTTAQIGNFDKPKTANFGTGTSPDYEGSLVRAINVAHTMTLNEYLDGSICPCGQASDVSPFGKVALMNENKDFSTTPSSIYTSDKPVNWFFADIPANITFTPYVFYRDYDRLKYQQFAPKAYTTVNSAIVPMNLVPYVSWGLRSLVLSIEVAVTLNNSNPITGAQTWVSLDDWKNNYSETHYANGMRLFVRGCTAINSTTLKLTYNNERNISTGQRGALAILNKFNILNGGANVDTQFLALNRIGFSSAYIFDKTPRLFNEVSSTGANDRAFMPAYQYFENQTIEFYREDSERGYYYYKIPYSENNYNKFMQIAALFGCYFTPTNKYEFDIDMLDNDLYLPILDDNGVAHGQYTRGAANATNALYSKNSIRDIDYDPDAPPTPIDPNTYSNVTGFNSITNNAALTKFYVLDSANVEKLGDDLWTICDGLSSGDFEHFDGKIKDEFLTTNPIDSIIALKRFPFNIPHTFNPNKVAVQLGKSTGTAQGYRTYEILFGVNFQGVDIFPRFGDCFLDYSPYTKYELYIPFCGTVEINAGDILGHTLNCHLLIDLLTGSCIAYIMADQLVIGTAKGSCGVDMQMSGAQTATMNANIFNGILNAQLAETQHITSIGKISLNPFKWYENIEVAETRQLQTQHDITHMVVPLHKMGSASPLLSWVQEFNARLMIYYPEGDVITSTIPPDLNAAAVESFGHIKGFATATPGKVSNFQRIGKQCYLSGNIVADSIPCTDNERQRIIAAFNSGVYLPSL